ncbi:MAG: hypothetical protein BWX69_03250 [Planctomycetes bacterium ADurb.Bin069]|nr:MAG: hypothetical protein BWX69_03250 [Planctomycetes bacterium ADurb.Bin069]
MAIAVRREEGPAGSRPPRTRAAGTGALSGGTKLKPVSASVFAGTARSCTVSASVWAVPAVNGVSRRSVTPEPSPSSVALSTALPLTA